MAFYGTAAGFRAYHTARNRNVAAYDDDAEINGALLIASEWEDGRYRASFPGRKVGYREQVREWPRTGAYDVYGDSIAADVIPVEMDNGAYEAALRELITPGSLIKDYTPGKYDSVSIAGAVSVKYTAFNSASDTQTQFAVIDQILSPILSGSGNVSMLSGSTTRT